MHIRRYASSLIDKLPEQRGYVRNACLYRLPSSQHVDWLQPPVPHSVWASTAIDPSPHKLPAASPTNDSQVWRTVVGVGVGLETEPVTPDGDAVEEKTYTQRTRGFLISDHSPNFVPTKTGVMSQNAQLGAGNRATYQKRERSSGGPRESFTHSTRSNLSCDCLADVGMVHHQCIYIERAVNKKNPQTMTGRQAESHRGGAQCLPNHPGQSHYNHDVSATATEYSSVHSATLNRWALRA